MKSIEHATMAAMDSVFEWRGREKEGLELSEPIAETYCLQRWRRMFDFLDEGILSRETKDSLQ